MSQESFPVSSLAIIYLLALVLREQRVSLAMQSRETTTYTERPLITYHSCFEGFSLTCLLVS